jgi:hypothetical protein
MPFCKQNLCFIRRSFGFPCRNEPLPSLSQTILKFNLSSGESLADASNQQPLSILFLRHFGCTFTRQLLRHLMAMEQYSRSHGSRLVLVHMLQQGAESSYLSGHDQIARISDPHCELYRAFGLGQGTLLELFGPRVLWFGALSLLKGCGVGHLAGDGLQMPGAFLFHQGEIVSAQRASSASQLPDLNALFAAQSK